MAIRNLGAERSVIGNIMMDGEKVMPEAVLHLTKHSFTDPICSHVFGACMALYENQQPIDVITVAEKASGTDNDTYLQECILMAEETPTVSNYKSYIQIVKQCSQIRAAREKTESLLTALEDVTDTEALRSQAIKIAACFDDSTTEDAVSARAGFLRFYDNLDKKKQYLSTGFGWLDHRIYFDKGKYMVVGGRPSSGKTALTLQMALHLAKYHNVVYFSLETGVENLYERLAVCYTKVSFSKVKLRDVSDEELCNICDHTDTFSALHLQVVQAAGWTTSQIRAKAIQLKADVIFIDYLTLIQSPERSQYEKATQISIDLHTMAQQLQIAVVALAQLNRSGGEHPDMTSIRESGQIEQDADIILMLHQPDKKRPDRKISVSKCKDGVVGCHTYYFDGDTQTFTDLDTIHRENEQ